MTPLDVLSEAPSISQIKSAISYVAIKYGVEESELLKVASCESEFLYNAKGDNGKAYGIFQFHKPTFDNFCEGNYYSAKDQIICAAKMWQTPKLKLHWSCWRNYVTH